MKRLLLFLLLVVATLGAAAQQTETADVYLRDGRVVRGHIVERMRGGMIRVQTPEGQSFTFLPAQVLNVVDLRGFSPFVSSPYWTAYAEVGYTTPNQYDVQLTGGVQLRNFLFVGAVWAMWHNPTQRPMRCRSTRQGAFCCRWPRG